MRLDDYLEHPTLHSALTNVLPDQHHMRPSVLSFANTSLVVPPLPGGPGVWDVAMPLATVAAAVSLRSAHLAEGAGGMSGVLVIATRSQFEASSVSLGGTGVLGTAAYNAIYAKAASALNLSHKIFSSLGDDIALTEAYLTLTAPTTRVLRLVWINYGASNKTLDVRGEAVLYG